ncbi:MAG: TonB-dependent receptor [Nitrospirales bacterium]|nr:TonB-dependent receptor [Nitrospirales bacterium]
MLQGLGFGGGVFFQSGYELQLPNGFETDAYERVDAVVFYRPPKKAYDFAINVRNLLDATYIESPGTVSAYNSFGAPVSVFGTLRVSFSPDLDWKFW